MKFRELYMNGEIAFEDIHDYTAKWNFSDTPETLREYLGLTAEEEDVWISDSDEALEAMLDKARRTKVIFLDLDGTLLNDQKQLTEGNKQAIEKALKQGHRVVLTSGRPLVSVKILAQELGLTAAGCYAIAFNGGEVYDLYNHVKLYKKSISREYVRYIFDTAAKAGLHCQTYDDTNILAEKETRELACYYKRTNVPYKIVPDVTTYLQEDPIKMIVINIDDHEKLVRFREQTTKWCAGKLDRVFSDPDYLEFLAPGTSKGHAIHLLCETLGIPLQNTYAVGDAENDLSMLAAVAHGVAMANAEPEVKAAACYVTEQDNNHDGVAEVIAKFL